MPKASLSKTRLSQARKIAGITQVELAKISGTSLDYIRHIEAGDNPLSGSFAGKFGSYLGVSGDWLMGNGERERPPAITGGIFTKEFYEKWRSARMDPKARVELWRDYLKALIDESFSDDRWSETMMRDMLRIQLAMPGWPEAAGCAIKTAIKQAIQFNPPGELWSMLVDDFKTEPAPRSKRR